MKAIALALRCRFPMNLLLAGALVALFRPLCPAWELAAETTEVPAAQAQAPVTGPRLFRDKVEPHWFSDNTKFWYQVAVGRGLQEYVLVDAEAGTRKLAFDHERLAKALRQAGIKEAVPQKLALDSLQFEADLSAMDFRLESKGWHCDLKTYALSEKAVTNASSAALESVPHASEQTGEETSLTFHNRTGGEVRIYWLDTEGERRAYGALGPNEKREQHTYAGHIWIVTDVAGRDLGAFRARADAVVAEITESGPKPQSQPAPNRRRRSASSGTSPDGNWRVFVRESNLILTNLVSGGETKLSSNCGTNDAYSGEVYWSPDSKKVVALRTKSGDERKVYLIESSPKDQLQPKLQSYDYLKPGDRIPITKPHLFDVTRGCELPIDDALFSNPWSVGEIHWSPDSSRFCFFYNQRGHQILRVIAVDARTGAPKVLIEEQSKTFIDYSGKLFLRYVDTASEADSAQQALREILWMSERDGWNHLYQYDGQTGQVLNQITKGQWVVRAVDRVDVEKRQIWFRAGGIRPGQDPCQVHYCRVNFDGTGLVVLTEGDGTHTARFSPDARFFIDTWSRVDLPPINELRRAEDGKLVCRLEQADTSELDAAGWRAPERFVAKGRDGETDIYGIIHWPKDFDPSRKYPVIESIYAGPQGSFVPKAFQTFAAQRRLTDRGFIVVQIDGMGTSNRSKKFHDVCWKNLGDAGFPDRILWLKAAALKHLAMDLERVGIYGTSAGGQSALRALLAHGDFYKAGVADCGCHDNRMDKIWWNEQWMGWPVGPEYEEQSNVTQAHRLQGKLLLLVGELDRNVDPSSTMQVVNALIKADKDFELLVVPGAGHGVLSLEYCQKRLRDFFTRAFLSGK